MNEPPEYLHHRLDQLRLLAMETTDPLAERLVRDMIAELEDRLTTDLKLGKNPQHSSNLRHQPPRCGLRTDACTHRPSKRSQADRRPRERGLLFHGYTFCASRPRG